MPAREFDGWCRFFRRYPFDPESLHLVPAALVASTIVNAHGGGKDGKTVSITDFLPKPVAPESPSPQSLDDKFKSFFGRLSARRKGAK